VTTQLQLTNISYHIIYRHENANTGIILSKLYQWFYNKKVGRNFLILSITSEKVRCSGVYFRIEPALFIHCTIKLHVQSVPGMHSATGRLRVPGSGIDGKLYCHFMRIQSNGQGCETYLAFSSHEQFKSVR
jgi:hypothetical protein